MVISCKTERHLRRRDSPSNDSDPLGPALGPQDSVPLEDMLDAVPLLFQRSGPSRPTGRPAPHRQDHPIHLQRGTRLQVHHCVITAQLNLRRLVLDVELGESIGVDDLLTVLGEEGDGGAIVP
jgi:hypothetical protein